MSAKPKTRVVIRPPKPSDGVEFIAALHRSRVLHGAWGSPKAKNAKEYAGYLQRLNSEQHGGYLVIDRTSGGLVGVININNIIRGAFSSASLGYFAFVPFAGQGLMHEGMRLVLRQAFGKLKLHRLEANIQPKNHPSIALAKKCGFVREGLSRRFLKIRGRWRHHERWALLA